MDGFSKNCICIAALGLVSTMLSACLSTTSPPTITGGQLDVDLQTAQAFFDAGGRSSYRALQPSGTASYRGYVGISNVRGTYDAIGELSAYVDLNSNRFSMSSGDFVIDTSAGYRNTSGNLTGSGSVVSQARVEGTLSGSVDGVGVSLRIFGNHTNFGLVGGSMSGSTHSSSIALD